MRFHYFFLPPGSVTQFLFLYMFYNNIYILDTNNNNNNDKLVMYITSDPERTYNIVNLVASTHFFFIIIQSIPRDVYLRNIAGVTETSSCLMKFVHSIDIWIQATVLLNTLFLVDKT